MVRRKEGTSKAQSHHLQRQATEAAYSVLLISLLCCAGMPCANYKGWLTPLAKGSQIADFECKVAFCDLEGIATFCTRHATSGGVKVEEVAAAAAEADQEGLAEQEMEDQEGGLEAEQKVLGYLAQEPEWSKVKQGG